MCKSVMEKLLHLEGLREPHFQKTLNSERDDWKPDLWVPQEQ
jgi:hypothetical protein